MRTVLLIIFIMNLCLNFLASYKTAFEERTTKKFIMRLVDCCIDAAMIFVFIYLMRTA